MPADARKAHKEILEEYKKGNEEFRNTVSESLKGLFE